MTCTACSAGIERTLNRLDGVEKADVSLMGESMVVEYDEAKISRENIIQAVVELGYGATHFNENVLKERKPQPDKLKKRFFLSILFLVPLMYFSMGGMIGLPQPNVKISVIIQAVLALAVIVIDFKFFTSGTKALLKRVPNMDTLVAVSTSVAYIFSVFNTLFPDFWLQRGLEPHVYFEASAGIIAFVSIGKMLEERAKDNTTTAITKLMGLQPQDVTRIADNGEMQVVPISSVVEGDLLMVRAGERIAVDGVVSSGESYVDESMLTGEHMPVRKYEGSSVYAGTLNGKGVLYYKVLKIGDSTLLSQIIHFVQEAQGSKAPVQRLVDKVASIFVPVVFTIAVVAFVVWLLLGGEDAFSHAILAFVTILVIACPCALGLATPTAITVGMGRAAQQGILIKSAEALENTCRVTSVVLDKTGTITQGSPAVVYAHWCEETLAKQVLYDIESRSEHPLALAVIAMLDGRTAGEITQYESLPGYGVTACIGVERYYIGNDALMTLHGIALPDELTRMAESWTREACTIVWVAAVDRILALLAIADPLKETSEQAIKALKQAGLKVYMLTGDNQTTAESIAHKVGIENVVAGVLPEQKAMYVKKLQQNGEVVAMIGDGINDSAALAQADVSIAMGHGSDIAMDVATMTIISDDLNRIAQAIHLSQLTTTTIRQNLFWAFIYNVIGIPIAAGVLYPCCGFLLNPMIASAAMAMSSVCVVSNSLRLNKKK